METEETVHAIFSLKGMRNQSQIKIKYENNMTLKENEYISDTLIEQYDIMKNVKGEIYKCNITDGFLMMSKKLPVMYISVILDKPLRRILLLRIYLFFIIESEIKSEKQLINSPINGKFSLEISIDDTKKEIDNKIEKYPGDEKMYEIIKNLTTHQEMKDLIDGIIYDIDKKLEEQYREEFEYFKPPTNIISLKNYKFD